MDSDYPLIDIDQLVQKLGPMPDGGLVILIGIPGSGKSSLAAQLAKLGFELVSSDGLREKLLGDATDLSHPDEIYQAARRRLAEVVTHRKRVVLDMMNVTRKIRRGWLSLAKQHGCTNIHLLVLDVPFDECRRRNRRRDRVVPEDTMRGTYSAMISSGAPGDDEGVLHVLQPGPDHEHYYAMPPEDFRNRRSAKLPPAGAAPKEPLKLRLKRENVAGIKLDIIGDVHGCYAELLLLLEELGYRFNLDIQDDGSFRDFRFTPPEADRRLAFVGDFADRGPLSHHVFALAMELYARNLARIVSGNHEEKLWRYLRGQEVKIGAALARTIAQIDSYGKGFTDRLCAFLGDIPYVYETDDLILVHGAYRENVEPSYLHALCLRGETDGTEDEHGFPTRLTRWEGEYAGDKNIFRGHDVVAKPRFRLRGNGRVIGNLDTGCVFGGRLTALRYPEMKLFSVAALDTYAGKFRPK